MRKFTVYRLTDCGGWGPIRQDICCLQATTLTRARNLAFETLATGRADAQLSLLTSWDIEEV